ncbi:MAG: hypothetical protein F6J97_21135 [Leptolyngbya sp. SIO4C1]|nr:hypothetical protein [Leptolyngbya sp. SIO4C1]
MFSTVSTTYAIRTELGDFSSIICFKAAVTGIEDALGEKAAKIALMTAGRARGKRLASELGLSQSTTDYKKITQQIQSALGKNGTRLCLVDKIEAVGSQILAHCRETICSSGEEPGSPRELSYTLGVMQGVLEEVTGHRLRGHQTDSVLRGGSHDVVAFEILA